MRQWPAERSIACSASFSSTSPGRPLTPTAPTRTLAVEDRNATEEEREERIEARALDCIVGHLLGELARRARVRASGGVRLPLCVQTCVGRGAVHRCGGDQLSVVVGHEHGHRPGRSRDDRLDDGERAGEPHPTAFFTSAPIRASSAAVSSFSANAVGHIAPSSRFALSLKPNVAYLVLNLWPLWKKQTTLPSSA